MATATLPQHSRDLALELRGLLEQLDPARWSPAVAAHLRSALLALREAIGSALASAESRGPLSSLRAALQEAWQVLTERIPAEHLPPRESRRAWKALRTELLAAYDRLGESLAAWDIHVPSLRPTNYTRNVFHVMGATGILITLAFVPPSALPSITLAFFVWAWTMETLRRRWRWLNGVLMATFAPVAHPHEWHRVNSATWYTTAMLALSWGDWLVAGAAGVAVLGLGDPAAAILGRRFGRIRLVHGRSLEGTLAFVVFGAGAALLALRLLHPELPGSVAAGAALAAAVTGALAELFSRRLDDNLTIPLCGAVGAALVLLPAGFPA